MRLQVYTIYDVKAAAYMRPFFMQSDGQAQRAFADLAVDGEHDIGRHPEDYSLFGIGHFDDDKGAISGEAPRCLCTALEMVALSQKVDKRQLNLLDKEVSDAA